MGAVFCWWCEYWGLYSVGGVSIGGCILLVVCGVSAVALCCSPDGALLASVGGEPDFMLTLWDWRQEQTVLRCKAYAQEVFRVTFSSELKGQLTSSGVGHIK